MLALRSKSSDKIALFLFTTARNAAVKPDESLLSRIPISVLPYISDFFMEYCAFPGVGRPMEVQATKVFTNNAT